ncbi:MAG: 4'-phosphopantetheinyl transferase superfamily protein [Ferruginibacter sp.]|nr:4'-phosphopantetheinyl transferase superfamily protein [Ferruginibacter sp.]
MPLVYQQNINESTRLGVWHIGEAETFFLSKVPVKKEITHLHKRLQHLAGRYLLKELFEDFPLELVEIADTRKPFLANEAFHFSISHCGDYAAVIVSRSNRVGVDIEIISEKAGRITDKFLSGEEQYLLNEVIQIQHLILKVPHSMLHPQLLTCAWSIKEAMFKWHGLGGIDFRKHLRIDHLEVQSNEVLATCSFLKVQIERLKVHGLYFGNNILTWTVS